MEPVAGARTFGVPGEAYDAFMGRYSRPLASEFAIFAGVAVEDEKIVGFVGFDRSRDEKSRPTTGEIWAIYAAPTHWSKGVGLALWDAARDGLQEEGCTNVTAWVPLRNERALRFHEMAGFKREMSTAKTAVVGGVKIEEVRLKRPIN